MKSLPNLRGLVDARAEQEIYRAFNALYEHYDAELKRIESNASLQAVASVRKQLDLFAANLAAPLINPVGNELATAGQETTLTPADIPNLDAAKITSGTFPLGRVPANLLKTDVALTVDVTGAPNVNTGKTTIKDNAGNTVTVMVCA